MFEAFIKMVVLPFLFVFSLAFTVESVYDYFFGVIIGLVIYKIYLED